MRQEKQFLVDEVKDHLGKSDYLYVTGFDRFTVEDVSALRKLLAAEEAEYHVVKNAMLDLALVAAGFPEMDREIFKGATAIIVGGKNPSGVAKILDAFANESGREEKLSLKCGVLDGRLLSADDVVKLSKLPSLDELRAKFLSLLQEPARKLLLVFNAGPETFVRLLVAYSKKEEK